MIASVLIILFSVALLVYWFRYSCILLLRNQVEAVESASALEDDRFRIGEVQARLQTEQQLDPLHAALQRDYEVLTYLLEHAAGLGLRSVEDRVLVLDYRIMQWWFRLTKTVAPDQAREALKEMASVMGVLLGKLSERASANSAL